MILDDICILIADCPHSTAPDEGNGYPLIRTPNIGFGRFSLDGVHRVSEAVYNERTVRAVPQDNDIILAREAPAGNAAIIKNNLKFCLGQRTVLIRPNPKMVYPDYLVYYLLAPEQQYKLLSKAHGATVAHVNIPDIHSMNVNNLPDLPTQRRIASILSAYDDLIENNRRQIKLLAEAAQRLYREWFVELRFPGHEGVKVMDGVPEGWKIETVGSLLRKIPRTKQILTSDYQVSGNIPIVDQSRDFIAGYTNDTDACVKPQDAIIVFGDHTRILKYITFPFAKGADGTQLIVSNSDCMPQSLFYFSIIHIDLTNYHYARHFKYLKESTILVPTKSIANAYDNIVHPIMKRIQVLRDSCVKAKEARDRLLPILMNREMEVSE